MWPSWSFVVDIEWVQCAISPKLLICYGIWWLFKGDFKYGSDMMTKGEGKWNERYMHWEWTKSVGMSYFVWWCLVVSVVSPTPILSSQLNYFGTWVLATFKWLTTQISNLIYESGKERKLKKKKMPLNLIN